MEKLKLTDVRKEFKFNMNKGISFDALDISSKSRHPYRMDYGVFLSTIGMHLQRPLCWTLHQKQQFILSLLKGSSIPKISIIQHRDVKDITGEKLNQVIDGKQRLNAYASFVNEEFALKTGHLFCDLDNAAQQVLLNFSFTADIAYSYNDKPISDADKIAWFEQINFTGTQQDDEHLIRLKYPGTESAS